MKATPLKDKIYMLIVLVLFLYAETIADILVG